MRNACNLQMLAQKFLHPQITARSDSTHTTHTRSDSDSDQVLTSFNRVLEADDAASITCPGMILR